MNRTACLVIVLLVGGLTMPFAFGQQAQPNPRLPDDVAGQQLIAWSWMQKPQPAPQPMPPKDAPAAQALAVRDGKIVAVFSLEMSKESLLRRMLASQALVSMQNPDSQSQQPTQTFTGKIVREGTRYVLKVASNSAYQLDEQDLKQYENQDVRVIGTVDKDRNMINVVKIELLS